MRVGAEGWGCPDQRGGGRQPSPWLAPRFPKARMGAVCLPAPHRKLGRPSSSPQRPTAAGSAGHGPDMTSRALSLWNRTHNPTRKPRFQKPRPQGNAYFFISAPPPIFLAPRKVTRSCPRTPSTQAREAGRRGPCRRRRGAFKAARRSRPLQCAPLPDRDQHRSTLRAPRSARPSARRRRRATRPASPPRSSRPPAKRA